VEAGVSDMRVHVGPGYRVYFTRMGLSNTWAEFAAVYRRTRPAFLEHEGAKADLKKLVPKDAKEATGHSLRAKRSTWRFVFNGSSISTTRSLSGSDAIRSTAKSRSARPNTTLRGVVPSMEPVMLRGQCTFADGT
jgi:hypothetical protein